MLRLNGNLISTPAVLNFLVGVTTLFTLSCKNKSYRITPLNINRESSGAYTVLYGDKQYALHFESGSTVSTSELHELPLDLRYTLIYKMALREINIDEVIRVTDYYNDNYRKTARTVVPEYERNLEHVIFSMGSLPMNNDKFYPLFFHDELLRNLPEYTKITIFAEKKYISKVTRVINDKAYKDRINLIAVETYEKLVNLDKFEKRLTVWAQDLLESVRLKNGKNLLILPINWWEIKTFFPHDNDYLETLEDNNTEVVRIPLMFRGGNINYDIKNNGETVLFVGEEELFYNKEHFYQSIMVNFSKYDALNVIKNVFGAKQAILMETNRYLFHIDMSFVLLGSNTVALVTLPENSYRDNDIIKTKILLSKYENIFRLLGYKIIFLETTPFHIKNFQSYSNAIPFRDKNTGERKIIAPIFPEPNSNIYRMDKDSLNYKNIQKFKQAGYEVIPIKDKFFFKHGNTHCSIFVIE